MAQKSARDSGGVMKLREPKDASTVRLSDSSWLAGDTDGIQPEETSPPSSTNEEIHPAMRTIETRVTYADELAEAWSMDVFNSYIGENEDEKDEILVTEMQELVHDLMAMEDAEEMNGGDRMEAMIEEDWRDNYMGEFTQAELELVEEQFWADEIEANDGYDDDTYSGDDGSVAESPFDYTDGVQPEPLSRLELSPGRAIGVYDRSHAVWIMNVEFVKADLKSLHYRFLDPRIPEEKRNAVMYYRSWPLVYADPKRDKGSRSAGTMGYFTPAPKYDQSAAETGEESVDTAANEADIKDDEKDDENNEKHSTEPDTGVTKEFFTSLSLLDSMRLHGFVDDYEYDIWEEHGLRKPTLKDILPPPPGFPRTPLEAEVLRVVKETFREGLAKGVDVMAGFR